MKKISLFAAIMFAFIALSMPLSANTDKHVDNQLNTIAGIPYGTTLEAFKTAIIPAEGATFSIFEEDGTTTAKDLKNGYKLIVTAEDTITSKTYTLMVEPSTETKIAFRGGKINHETKMINEVAYGISVEDFKKLVILPAEATFEIYEADGKTVATEKVGRSYKLVVTAGDGKTQRIYTVEPLPNKNATITFAFDKLLQLMGATVEITPAASN